METSKLIEIYESRIEDLIEEKKQIYEAQKVLSNHMTNRSLKGQSSNYLRKCLAALNRQSLNINAEVLSTKEHIKHLENLEKQEKFQGDIEDLGAFIECICYEQELELNQRKSS